MKTKRFLLLLSILAFTVFVSGCNKQFYPSVNDIQSANVDGELKHTQYWDKNDYWDVSSLHVLFVLKDGQQATIPLEDKKLSYEFMPSRPEAKITSFAIINLAYIDNNDKVFAIEDRIIFEVSVVPYPYESPQTDTYIAYVIIVLAFVSALIIGELFVIFTRESGEQ